MEAWLHVQITALLAWLSISSNSLTSLFAIAFVSATLLPMGSEPAVFLVVKNNPEMFWPAVLVATVGNTLGGVVTYLMGLGVKEILAKDKPPKYLKWFERFGPKALLLSFLPVVGDPLCALAGWFREPLLPCIFYMFVGKFLRYVAMTAGLLLIPDGFWHSLFGFLG